MATTQKILKSKFGKSLLKELSNCQEANIGDVIAWIEEDSLAGRLKADETGEFWCEPAEELAEFRD